MQTVVDFLKELHLHPFVDHFTVALVLVAILIDLFASLMPARTWLRYAAVTLLVLGAAAAAGSKVTGGWEAERVWDHLSGGQKDALRAHAQFGEYLAYALAGLAAWRLGLQFIGFLGRTRFVYLIVAVIAGGAILYQGDSGGDLVYEHGIGVAPAALGSPSSSESPGTAQAPTPVPTVYVPPPMPSAPSSAPSSPPAAPSPAASTAAPAAPAPSAAAASPEPSPVPSPAAKSTTL